MRSIFFKYTCYIERKLRSSISYNFCSKYGELQSEYLNPNNYNNNFKNKDDIHKLVKMLDIIANQNKDHDYLTYQRSKYKNVPLWAIMNALTFGQISKMFDFLPQSIQGKVCQDFETVKKNEMAKFLRVLTLFRNVCAHNERLFSYHTHIDIPDTLLHEKLTIPKNGSTYVIGKNDLFSVVIAFSYLLTRNDFFKFKKEMLDVLCKYEKSSSYLKNKEILKYMGFPENWQEIIALRKLNSMINSIK